MYRSDEASVTFTIGTGGSAVTIDCLGQANVSASMTIDTRNCIGSSSPRKTATQVDWNMSFNGVADISANGTQETLFNAFKAGTTVKVRIIYTPTGSTIDGYEGTVVLSDWATSLSAPGMAEVSFTGQGTGALNIVHT